MATLPDLDTGTIRSIFYWNAIDQGNAVSDNFEPTDVLSSGIIDNWADYDNGIEGYITPDYASDSVFTPDGELFRFRVKTDGWIMVWREVGNEVFGRSISSTPPDGEYMLFLSPGDGTLRGDDVHPNSMGSYLIDNLRSNLSASTSLDKSNIGVYNYAHPSATTMFMGVDSPGYDDEIDNTLSYSNTIDIKYHCISAASRQEPNHTDITFAGVQILGETQEFSALDALEQGLIPDPGTTYTASSTYTDGEGGSQIMNHIAFYS